jgi:nucleoid DNA-binding protein
MYYAKEAVSASSCGRKSLPANEVLRAGGELRPSGISQLVALEAMQMVFDGIMETLVEEGRIELRNFGVFAVKRRRARPGTQPSHRGEVGRPGAECRHVQAGAGNGGAGQTVRRCTWPGVKEGRKRRSASLFLPSPGRSQSTRHPQAQWKKRLATEKGGKCRRLALDNFLLSCFHLNSNGNEDSPM